MRKIYIVTCMGIRNGILYRRFCTTSSRTQFLQLIVPDSLHEEFIRQLHEGLTGGHLGILRTQDQIHRRGYWVGWRRQVQTYCRQCSTCSQIHRGKPSKHGRLQPLEANEPLDRCHVDLCGPFHEAMGMLG
jgi:Integrase zinc binding domain